MARLFDEHLARRVTDLSGTWKFSTDPEDLGERDGWNVSLPAGETVAVPSCWNNESGLLSYEGAAWYEKKFYTAGGCLRFCFGAVMTEATVWLDGSLLGRHYGGFSQFDFIVPKVKEGYHTLTVRADNRFDAQSIPQKSVDWYHYGGITRGVSVETLVGISVLSYRLEYELSNDLSDVEGHFAVECYNADETGKTAPLSISLGDTCVYQGEITVSGRKTVCVTLPSFQLQNVQLWNVGAPKLYDVYIKTDTDDLFDRVGFRKVEVKNGKILLNHKPVEMRGVNRHEEHPDFGMAFPLGRMKHDLDLIEDLGCNAIRGSHYPNSQEFVDYMDERGILFWSEIPIWGCGFSVDALADPVVVERGLEMHREMVKYYYNHPSVIFWGMHNEITSNNEAAYEMSKLYYNYLKENGGNRLVVYASHQPMTDICLEYSDVICLNLYYGWYGWYSDALSSWEDALNNFCKHRDELGLSDKPIIMSEFGAAALYGFHDAERPKWSEEYQAELLSHCLQVFHTHPAMVGSFIWQFCDIRTCSEMGFSRARGFNNKGIMNENRRPKAAYYAVRDRYRAFAEEDRT
ncbi:MAG: beta-glucuronidase [Clostridia bacterium]|nr:beta-glucuronidase [Clostridia bacterium]